jgi:hypothetical protein
MLDENSPPLGKGEVHSSILCGSTRKPHKYRVFSAPQKSIPAVTGRTLPEHDATSRGKSVDFVRQPFTPKQLARAFKRRRAIEQWSADLQAIACRAQFRLDCIALNARDPDAFAAAVRLSVQDLAAFEQAYAEHTRR